VQAFLLSFDLVFDDLVFDALRLPQMAALMRGNYIE
jgi:hypothetical protein